MLGLLGLLGWWPMGTGVGDVCDNCDEIATRRRLQGWQISRSTVQS